MSQQSQFSEHDIKLVSEQTLDKPRDQIISALNICNGDIVDAVLYLLSDDAVECYEMLKTKERIKNISYVSLDFEDISFFSNFKN